jgi:hypothetical protein
VKDIKKKNIIYVMHREDERNALVGKAIEI